jgi:flagellin-like protein
MNKKGVSEVIAVVLLIVLVIAAATILGYIYNNFLFRQSQNIENMPLEELGLEGSKAKVNTCNSVWNCDDWSECEVGYNLGNLIEKEINLKGTKSRYCVDANKCSLNKVESEICSTKELVTVKEVEKCGRKYLEIKDSEEKVVSRVELKQETEELVIDLIIGKKDYCSYCYDGTRDFDEDGVDCVNTGDNCPICPAS